MFIPPSFEPTGPREPQWFPRPITDSIESSLDLLERLEEDRKRRLRGIANVNARLPIGMEGGGEGSNNTSLSPKVPSGVGPNNYSRYRYYPPPESGSGRLESMATPSITSVHALYTKKTLTPYELACKESVWSDRKPNFTGRHNIDSMRDGPRGSHRIGRTSVGSTSSDAPPFASPPLDPRAGGARRIQHMHPGRPIMSQVFEERLSSSYDMNIDTAATPTAGDEEYVTPPAMEASDHTPGHGRVDDIYSQRRGASNQRRRRRGWDD